MTDAEFQRILDQNAYVGCFNVLDLTFQPQADVAPEVDKDDGDSCGCIDCTDWDA